MKKLCMGGLLLLSLWTAAQPGDPAAGTPRATQPPAVTGFEVSLVKTIHLVFPSAIVSIDRGSAAILVQKAQGVDNVLKIKAGMKDFEATSLSVITTGNRLYTFVVTYADTLADMRLNISIRSGLQLSDTAWSAEPVTSPVPLLYNSPESLAGTLASYAAGAGNMQANMHGLKDGNGGVKLVLNGLYVRDNYFFTRLQLTNATNIHYDIEQLRFYIRDRKQGKRTATQELEIKPVFIQGDSTCIAGQGGHSLIIVLPKFTIPDGKYLIVEMMEKDGGRHLCLKVPNRKLIKAKTL